MSKIWKRLSKTSKINLLLNINASHSLSNREFEELPGWVKDLMNLKLKQEFNI